MPFSADCRGWRPGCRAGWAFHKGTGTGSAGGALARWSSWVTGTSSAWAVGWVSSNPKAKTLILHWNGKAWTLVPSPTPAGGAALNAVAAPSASSAWAVGCSACGSHQPKTLIVHWNGTALTRVPSPTPAGGAVLAGVAATSASSAWAVGSTGSEAGLKHKTVVLRWNGTAWTHVPSPTPAGGAILLSVAATSGPERLGGRANRHLLHL